MIPSVAHSGELQRILSLPRRTWATDDLASLASALTEILRVTGRTCPDSPADAATRARRERLGICHRCAQPLALRPQQALALHDAGTEGGLFAPLGVGEGKTLITLLLAAVLQAKRPLLLLPGGLIEKSTRDREALSYHWQVPTRLRVMSYDVLGRVDHVDALEAYAPDLVIGDEIHRLKNKRAAVTRRVTRYMHDHPTTAFCGLSGSVMDRSIKEFAHILCWALKTRAPIPTSAEEVEEWSEALDNGVDPMARRRPGALLELCSKEELAEHPPHVAARHGFRRRLTESPGVVATIGAGEEVGCAIYVRVVQHKVSPLVQQHFAKLRGQMLTPDDWELMSGADVWRHAQELALGLHYAWDPRPPDAWRRARAAWNKFVRETISRSRTYDSELHVANACDAGKLPSETLDAWRSIQPSFTPNVVAIWHDDSALKVCRDWMAQPGIVWTAHGLFAQRLAEFTGATYYGAGGFSEDGRYIQDAKRGSTVIASIDANREGKDLQTLWSRNLMVCPPPQAAWWEQTIARTHRPGQTADEVVVDVLLGCRENYDACCRAIDDAQAIQDMTGKRQKLMMATIDITRPLDGSPAWQESAG